MGVDSKRNNVNLRETDSSSGRYTALRELYGRFGLTGLMGDSGTIGGGFEHLIGLSTLIDISSINSVSIGDLVSIGNRRGVIVEINDDDEFSGGEDVESITVESNISVLYSTDVKTNSLTDTFKLSLDSDSGITMTDGGISSHVGTGNILIYKVGLNKVSSAVERAGFSKEQGNLIIDFYDNGQTAYDPSNTMAVIYLGINGNDDFFIDQTDPANPYFDYQSCDPSKVFAPYSDDVVILSPPVNGDQHYFRYVLPLSYLNGNDVIGVIGTEEDNYVVYNTTDVDLGLGVNSPISNDNFIVVSNLPQDSNGNRLARLNYDKPVKS